MLKKFFNLVECFSCISMFGGSSKYRESESNHNFLCWFSEVYGFGAELVLLFRRWGQLQDTERVENKILGVEILIFVRFQVYSRSSVATIYHGA